MKDVKFALAPASTAWGRVVEGDGWPSSGRVWLLMVDGPGDAHWKMSQGSAGIDHDQDGRFRFAGLVPSASYEAWFVAEAGTTRGRHVLLKRIGGDRAGPDRARRSRPRLTPAPAPERESMGDGTKPRSRRDRRAGTTRCLGLPAGDSALDEVHREGGFRVRIGGSELLEPAAGLVAVAHYVMDHRQVGPIPPNADAPRRLHALVRAHGDARGSPLPFGPRA